MGKSGGINLNRGRKEKSCLVHPLANGTRCGKFRQATSLNNKISINNKTPKVFNSPEL